MCLSGKCCLRLAILFTLALLHGCGKDEKSGHDLSKREPAKEKPDFVLSAEEFADDCRRTQTEIQEKYAGKIVEFSGEVQSLMYREASSTTLFLRLVGNPSGVMCEVSEGELWTRVAPQQKIKLRGTWSAV